MYRVYELGLKGKLDVTERHTHRVEIESYLEERAWLVEEITRLEQAVPA